MTFELFILDEYSFLKRICFVLKDDQGDVVATGMSPPIMITDDHKSSKQNNHNRKRVREEEKPDTPAPSRPGSVYNGEEDYPVESMTTTFDPVLLLSDESDKHKPVNQRKQTRRKKQTRQKHPKQPKKRDSKQEEPMILLPQSTEMVYDGVFYMNDVLPCLSDPIDFLSVDISPEESAEDAWPFNRRRKIDNDYYIPHDGLLPMLDEFMSVVPQLERLVPAQGPTYGGIEVTILGKGFYQGLTCLFGEHPATTAYWNSSTMVCILPPVAHTGPVVVSFKEHPVVLECHDVAIFTYYDASDQALLELALQVVGLKMTGKLHDAKDVAMRIVQGDQPNRQSTHNICQSNDSGHTLLHLAVILNYDELIKSLLAYPTPNEESDLVNMKDKNGMTALHFACLLGHVDLVKVLLKAGADPSLQSLQLKTPGALNDSTIISGLLSSYTNLRRKSLTRRPSVKSHMTHRFHSLTGKELPANVDANKAPSMESDGLGLVRQKLDRRLYLFWLPVLIVAIGLLCVQFIGRPSVIFESLLEKKIQDHSISLGA
ncbi:hypothetical protein BDB01DRAFT_202385 [Pilobolus umbonatus]|nr:hypothetical protein BDB01DRAFT_202385 [Pilobolus umbonatus]